MAMNQDIRRLEHWGTDYFKNGLLQKKEKLLSYNKKQIPIGTKRNGKPYMIDVSEAFRAIYVGATRSGKTFLLRGMSDRMKLAGWDIVYLNDIKNEFFTSSQPVQDKFKKLLLDGERPQGSKVISLRPTFFKKFFPELPEGNLWYSPNIAEMSKADFLTLLDADAQTSAQQVILEIVYDQLWKKSDADKKSLNFSMIDGIISEIKEISSQQKRAMTFKFRPLAESKFYEPEHAINVVNALKRGYSFAVNMEGFENFSGTFNYPSVVMGILLRKVIEARRAKQIRPLYIVFDEASRFIPNDRNPSVKRDVMESVDIDARFGISYGFATQEISKIPPEVVRQCRYIFLPHSVSVSIIKDALTMTGHIRNMQTGINDALRMKGRMKRFDWLVLDVVTGTKEIIRPLAPLSWHRETGE
jgi:hypothetical protein